MKNKAIPFIVKAETTSQYCLTQEGENLLKSLDKPFSVVSVAGMYRTGKSYLLNSIILDKKNVFEVGPTTNACTKGLWLWVESDPFDKRREMLVIDTEGLGALDEESNHDMKIFCLSVLLSTTFIYNSFGNIDENALQTLSFVLNLLHSIDQDQLSSRPHFIWVVRDFSLQLIDADGRTITPAQYLQIALATTSKQEHKNTIRRTIQESFPSRDCFTLIKPIIDELKLQNLDKVPIDQLRPEFVTQSLELRNKIKNSLTSFKLNGKNQLSGKDYLMVVRKYLTAINSGAVPNILDTWTFIKEQKRRQAILEIKDIFTPKIQHKILEKIPMRNAILERLFFSFKEQIFHEFTKLAYDQSSEELEEYLKKLYRDLDVHNKEENQRITKKTLEKQYQHYQKKLLSNYYLNYEEFQNDVKQNFKSVCSQKYGEKYEGFKEGLTLFCDERMIDSFKYFQKRLKEQIKKHSQIKHEMEKTFETEHSSLKLIWEKQKLGQNQRILELETQIKYLVSEKTQLEEMLKTEKTVSENNVLGIKRKNQQLSYNISDLTNEIQTLQCGLNEARQKLFLQTKQHQKQKALYNQKQEHWVRKFSEVEKKGKQLEERLKRNMMNNENERKDLVRQYQQRLNELEYRNKQLDDRLLQSENKLSDANQTILTLRNKIQNDKEYSITEKKKLEQKIISAQSNKKPSKIQKELKSENQELQEQLKKLTYKFNEKQIRFKGIQEEIKVIESEKQKEVAIHLQQIQFQQIQIKELKERYDQLKKSYQNALQSMNDTSKSIEQNTQMKIFQMNSEHQKEVNNIQSEYEEKFKMMKEQIQLLEKQKEQQTLKISLERKKYQNKQKQLKDGNYKLQELCEKLQNKLKCSEKDYEGIFKQKETYFSRKMKQLEEQVEKTKEKAAQEIQECQKKSEQTLQVLKHYSDMQKEQWQKRMQDEREKSSKRLTAQKDEFERKINEQKQSFEQQINELQQRLAHMDRVYNQKLQNMEYDYQIKLQKIENESREKVRNLETNVSLCKQQIEINQHNFERQLLSKKKSYEENIQCLKKNLAIEYEASLSKIKEEKDIIEQKHDSLKKNNRQLEQSNMVLKHENEKDRAIFKEKQQYYEKKIIETENQLQKQLQTFNKVIENINEKNDIEREKLNRQIQRLNVCLLEMEQQKNKMEGQFQIEKNRLISKVNFTESQKQKVKEDYDDILKKFQVTVSHLTRQKGNNQRKKKDEIENLSSDYQQRIKQLQDGHKRMIKNCQDRISRLSTQNKSLKDRLTVMELERSSLSSKKRNNDEFERSMYEKRIDEYKQLLERQKQRCRKLKQENAKLKNESQFSERGSFIHDLSPGASRLMNNGENRPLIISKKTTSNNTPLIAKKSRKVDISQFGAMKPKQ